MAFEAKAGQPVTGEATPGLLAAIRAADRLDLSTAVKPPPAQQDPASPAAPPAAADSLVAAIQRALARAAYGPLNADGVVGSETREAIKRFQRDHALPVTGEITDALVIELRADGAMDEGG
jgi:peptidoglycan hydrolase-like protein with peptidoglycan-binding domain